MSVIYRDVFGDFFKDSASVFLACFFSVQRDVTGEIHLSWLSTLTDKPTDAVTKFKVIRHPKINLAYPL